MAQKQNSRKVTVANILAAVGLVLLLVFTYFGHSYVSGGELGWDIVISVGITAFTAFLLWFLIKAKGAENELNKWRTIEYSILTVYIVFAIPASLLGGIMNFFVVNDNKEEIKAYARKDIDKINNLILEYEDFEKDALANTLTGLHNATGPNQEIDDKLYAFMSENCIEHNRTSTNNFVENVQRPSLIGANFETYRSRITQQEQEILSAVNGWSIIQIPFKVKMIEDLALSVEEQLTKNSQEAKLPKIEPRGDGVYTITESNQSRDFRISGGVESFQFKQALRNASGFSFTAVLIVLLIHILILFNYLVAYRTDVLGISKKREEDGGITL